MSAAIDTTQTALLVLSCDKYADVWPPFFDFFARYWKNCPYKIYLGVNENDFVREGVTVIKSGKARSWTEDTRAVLEQLKERNIILLLEDYFLNGPADEQRLQECIALLEKENAAFMRIACFPKDHFSDYAYDKIPASPWCGETRAGAPYRVNLQAGLWHRESFLAILSGNENPWQFEINASKRSANMPQKFLGLVENPKLNYVHGPVQYLCTAVTKGKWMYDAVQLARREGIALDTSARPVESRWQYMRRRAYHSLPFGLRPYVDYISSKFRRQA
ncbi:MAG: hypothetical protein MUC87_08395 [Bacteroidia bacterium]|jgi:hypothetical protein|nr:hypothetical protein [Bacteroidia bacterium]